MSDLAGVLAVHAFVSAAAALACGIRAHPRTPGRRGWALLAVAAGTPAAVLLGAFAVDGGAPHHPAAALAAAHLTAFPALFVAIMLLASLDGPSLQRSAWLDGAISAATVTAAAAAAAPLVRAGALSTATAAVAATAAGLAAVAALMAAAMLRAVGRHRAGARRRWSALTRALVALAALDALHVAALAAGRQPADRATGLVLAAGPVLLALPRRGAEEHRQAPARPADAWLVITGPVLFGAVALAVDALALVRPLPAGAGLAATVALALLGARVVLSMRELAGLAEVQRQATTDELTGLGNRRRFYGELRRHGAIAQGAGQAAARQAGAFAPGADGYAVLRVDLNRFKAINDALGHTTGDVVLQLVAQRLRAVRGPGEVLARLGSDEFAFLVPGDAAPAWERARAVTAALAAPLAFDGVVLQVAATVGIARLPAHGRDEDEVMAAADVALAHARQADTPVAEFDPDGDTAVRDAVALTAQLRSGMATGQLVVHFQPKIDLGSGRLASLEALVRWRHPDRGVLAPAAFLPLAVEAGLLGALTDTVLRQAIEELAELYRLGVAVPVAVNVGSASLMDDRFPEHVQRTLDRVGLPASALTIEITEDSVLLDPRRALAMLGRLRAMGVGLSIDDYGTGRASLGYLRDIPATELKIDRSFSALVLEDAKVAAMVRSTVQLAHDLGLAVVAEGIETPAVGDALAAMGVDVGQGFLYGRPLPFEALLASPPVATALTDAASPGPVPARPAAAGRTDRYATIRR